MELNESTADNTSFGSLLKKTREKKKITIEAVAKDLFIKERQIEALENEDFEKLPQYTFTKGFALKYANYLALNIADITAKFDDVFPENKKILKTSDIKAPLTPIGTLTRNNRKSFNFKHLWLTIAIAAVIVLAIFFYRTISDAEKEQNAPTQLQDGITVIEQQQGASIETDDSIPSSGSAINIE